jgi:hypothetical protein
MIKADNDHLWPLPSGRNSGGAIFLPADQLQVTPTILHALVENTLPRLRRLCRWCRLARQPGVVRLQHVPDL